MRALVTGSNGFVGSHLVRYLKERGDHVRAMLRQSSNRELLADVDVELAFADVTDDAGLDEAVDGVDVVYHVAGVIAALDDAGFDRVNIGGTQRVVQAMQRTAPGARLVLVSSMSAAGPATLERPRTESDPEAPVSGYGRSKLRAEAWLRENDGGLWWSIARPVAVYGSGDSATLDLYATARSGIATRLLGAPRQLSWIHVRDLAEGLVACAERDEARGEAFFLNGPEPAATHEFQQAVARRLGVGVTTLPVPTPVLRAVGAASTAWGRLRGRPGFLSSDKVADGLQVSWLMSGAKSAERLGFAPQTTLDDGIDEALAWYIARGRVRPV